MGTLFEWYDFCLYGCLAASIGAQFFSNCREATRNAFALLAFAAGFLVRPFGALPATALAMVAQTGDIDYGLWCPVLIALATVVIGLFCVPETKDRDIYAHDWYGFAFDRLRIPFGLSLSKPFLRQAQDDRKYKLRATDAFHTIDRALA